MRWKLCSDPLIVSTTPRGNIWHIWKKSSFESNHESNNTEQRVDEYVQPIEPLFRAHALVHLFIIIILLLIWNSILLIQTQKLYKYYRHYIGKMNIDYKRSWNRWKAILYQWTTTEYINLSKDANCNLWMMNI